MCALRICSYAPAPDKEHCCISHMVRDRNVRDGYYVLRPRRRHRPPATATRTRHRDDTHPEYCSHQRRGSARRYSTTAPAAHAAATATTTTVAAMATPATYSLPPAGTDHHRQQGRNRDGPGAARPAPTGEES